MGFLSDPLDIIARIHNDFPTKFGLPRQAGLAPSLYSKIVFEPSYRIAEALRGLDGFSYIWLIWGFSANDAAESGGQWSPTVRPPRLGGNVRMGVFATRSPYRPNPVGLSSVRLESIEADGDNGLVLIVSGADLMDGTPIYDVKPYVAYADAYPEARSGFVDDHEWHPLEVEIPESVAGLFTEAELRALREVLAQDPRPRFHNDAQRLYGMPFAGRDVRFRIADGVVKVEDAI